MFKIRKLFVKDVRILFSRDCPGCDASSFSHPLTTGCGFNWIHVSMQAVDAQAPLMHQGMSVTERVENSLCGYVLLDIFKLLAQKECRRRCLPTGSLWMSPQTHRNMQYVVMGLIHHSFARQGSLWKPVERLSPPLNRAAHRNVFRQTSPEGAEFAIQCEAVLDPGCSRDAPRQQKWHWRE